MDGRRLGYGLLALGLAACGAESPSVVPLDREATLGPFLSDHWRLPVPPQGPAPAHFGEGEGSLHPRMCGACHPEQLQQWQSSLHAAAYSPGLSGQLVEGSLSHPFQVRSCNSCHAPLAEQQPYDAALAPNPVFDPALRAQGLVCAGCHVRGQRRYGPPPRPDAPIVSEPLPHDGFEVRSEFLESRFCAPCHQFFGDPGINGKPVENTYVEWLASPQAAEGRQCQDCHMPDRAHLWRGIHDPEMVRQALDVELQSHGVAADGSPTWVLVLRNRDVGHAFPTYVTPRVTLSIEQLDASGEALVGTRVEAVVAREVDLARGVEVFDTRVLPGQSVRLDYETPARPGAVELRGQVVVDPNYFYRRMFTGLLPGLTAPEAREQIAEALQRIADSAYLLVEIRRTLSAEQTPGPRGRHADPGPRAEAASSE